MANALLTPRQMRALVEGAVLESQHPDWKQIYTSDGWDLSKQSAYWSVALYDKQAAEQWKHVFTELELRQVSAMSPAAFHDYLIEKWPEVFAPPAAQVKLADEWLKLAQLRIAAHRALEAVDEQCGVISELLGRK